jgi:hypothetical protein
MTIKSHSLISELKTFVALAGGYSAKVGETDDLVMSTLLITRIMTELSAYHSDLDTHLRDHEEFIAPLPFFAVIS